MNICGNFFKRFAIGTTYDDLVKIIETNVLNALEPISNFFCTQWNIIFRVGHLFLAPQIYSKQEAILMWLVFRLLLAFWKSLFDFFKDTLIYLSIERGALDKIHFRKVMNRLRSLTTLVLNASKFLEPVLQLFEDGGLIIQINENALKMPISFCKRRDLDIRSRITLIMAPFMFIPGKTFDLREQELLRRDLSATLVKTKWTWKAVAWFRFFNFIPNRIQGDQLDNNLLNLQVFEQSTSGLSLICIIYSRNLLKENNFRHGAEKCYYLIDEMKFSLLNPEWNIS